MPTVEPADMEPGREPSDSTRLVSTDSGRQGPRGRRVLYVLLGVVVGSIILVAIAALLVVGPTGPGSSAARGANDRTIAAPPAADEDSAPAPGVRAPDGRPVGEAEGESPPIAAPVRS